MFSLTAGKDEITELLECYKGLRCLWDTECKQYLVRSDRNEAYSQLLEIFKKIPGQANATMEQMKKKLENMRTAYKRELKKIQQSTQEGDSIYSPTLWYFHYLTFLDGFETSPTDHKDDINFQLGVLSLKKDQTSPPKKKRPILKRKQEHLIEVAPAPVVISSKEDVMGQSVGLQLKELSAFQQTIAQKLISDIIFYGKMNKLTEFSTITLSTTTQ